MPDRWDPLDLADFTLLVEAASGISIERLRESDGFLLRCQAALVPHQMAIEQNASFADVLALLGIGVVERKPSPSENDLAAMLAMDELVYINLCVWRAEISSAEIGGRLSQAEGRRLSLEDFVSWLSASVACESGTRTT